MGVMHIGRIAIVASLCVGLGGCEKPPPGTEYCSAVSKFVAPKDCEDFTRQAAFQDDGHASFNAPNPMRRGDTVAVWLAVADQPHRAEAAPAPTVSATPGSAPAPADQKPAPAATSASSQDTTTAPQAPVKPEAEDHAPTPAEIVDPMPGRTVTFDAIVGPRMAADLAGDSGFEIAPAKGEDKHKVLRMGPPYAAAIWKWDVTAIRGGVHTLAVRTVVEAIDRKGEFHEMVSTPATFSFTVEVSPWQAFWDDVVDAPKKIGSVTGVVTALTALVTALGALWAALRRKRKRAVATSAPEGDPEE
jgi:hypothetical protein